MFSAGRIAGGDGSTYVAVLNGVRDSSRRRVVRLALAVARVAPRLQFDSEEGETQTDTIRTSEWRYWPTFPPNAVWGAAYDLMNVVHNEADERTHDAFAAEEPRGGPPPLSAPPMDRMSRLP